MAVVPKAVVFLTLVMQAKVDAMRSLASETNNVTQDAGHIRGRKKSIESTQQNVSDMDRDFEEILVNSSIPLEFVEASWEDVSYDFTDVDIEDKPAVFSLSGDEINKLIANQNNGRKLASSSAAALQSVVGGTANVPAEAVGAAVLGGCYAAGLAACGGTLCLSAPIAAAACPAIAFFTSIIFGAIDFGNPKNDNAWLTVYTGSHQDSGGKALGIKYHRFNGDVDTDGLGSIGVDSYKTWEEDLDASWLKYIEFYVHHWDDVCVKSVYITAGIEPSSTGELETIVLTAPQFAYITRRSIGSRDCIWFGDSEGAVGNFMFRWLSALRCRDNFILYGNSKDFVNCMRYAMIRYDIRVGGSYQRYTFPSNGNLPSHHSNPYHRPTNKAMDYAWIFREARRATRPQ